MPSTLYGYDLFSALGPRMVDPQDDERVFYYATAQRTRALRSLWLTRNTVCFSCRPVLSPSLLRILLLFWLLFFVFNSAVSLSPPPYGLKLYTPLLKIAHNLPPVFFIMLCTSSHTSSSAIFSLHFIHSILFYSIFLTLHQSPVEDIYEMFIPAIWKFHLSLFWASVLRGLPLVPDTSQSLNWKQHHNV